MEGAPEGSVALLAFANQNAEARGIARLIERLIDHENIRPNGILVLLRTDS
jgi:hypothetical protein